MALTGEYIRARVRTVLQDEKADGDGIRWKDPELLQWINDAQREIVLIRPSANTVTEPLSLEAGTLQTLPASGVSILKIMKNTSGKGVFITESETLHNENPDWHQETPAVDVSYYVYDSNDPLHFYVYPPNDGTGSLDVTYSKVPVQLNTLTDELSLPEIFANQIVDYALFRCYLKDARNASSATKANTHYQLFRESLGLKATAMSQYNAMIQQMQSRALQPTVTPAN